VLVLMVVVLVLDLWDFGAEKRVILFHHFDCEMCSILEHEHEHEFSISAFAYSVVRRSFAGPFCGLSRFLWL
jgi:hypothetical protein